MSTVTTTTPSADQFGSSNLAFTTDGLNYSYLTNSAYEMTIDGFAGDPLGDGSIVIDAPFAPTLTLHQFPRQARVLALEGYGGRRAKCEAVIRCLRIQQGLLDSKRHLHLGIPSVLRLSTLR